MIDSRQKKNQNWQNKNMFSYINSKCAFDNDFPLKSF